MAEKVYMDPEIGQVHLVKKLGIKRVTLSVSGRERIRVRMNIPYFVTYDYALKFFLSKREWVLDMVAKRRAEIEAEKNGDRPTREELLKMARACLPERAAYLSERYGLEYRSLTLMNRTTAWGTCSTENRLKLNISLMMLPEYLRDFVILHELTHLRHHDHSPLFHRMLEGLCGDYFRDRLPAGLKVSRDSKYPVSHAMRGELKKYRP